MTEEWDVKLIQRCDIRLQASYTAELTAPWALVVCTGFLSGAVDADGSLIFCCDCLFWANCDRKLRELLQQHRHHVRLPAADNLGLPACVPSGRSSESAGLRTCQRKHRCIRAGLQDFAITNSNRLHYGSNVRFK